MRRAGKIIGFVLLGLVGLVLVLVLSAGAVLRSQWGQRQLFARLQPVLGKLLTGELRIGGISGDLLHSLTLHQVELTDAEGRTAVRVGRARLRYNLLGLLHRTVHLTSAEVEGGFVHARPLKDGRLNLAALLRPRPPSEPTRLTIRVGDVRLQAELLYEGAAPDGPLRRVHSALALQGAALVGLADQRLDVRVQRLQLTPDAPLRAAVALRGRLQREGEALRTEGLRVDVTTTGEELTRLAPAARLGGPLAVELQAQGPLQQLQVLLTLRPPAGTLVAQGMIGALDERLPWRLTLTARGVDPHALRPDLPPLDLQLDAAGEGAGARGQVQLRGLQVQAAGARLQAQGRYDLGGDAEASATLDVSDVAAAAKLAPVTSLPKLAGRAQLRLSARREQRRWGATVELDGQELRAAEAQLARLHLRASTQGLAEDLSNLNGALQLHGERVRAQGIDITRAALQAEVTRDALRLTASASGLQQTALALTVHGRPLFREAQDEAQGPRRPIGATAQLQRLSVARGGERWELARAAQLRYDGDAAQVRGLDLRSGEQRVLLSEALLHPRSRRLRAVLDVSALDARRAANLALLPPQQPIPHTRLNLRLRADGTLDAPHAEVSLQGTSQALPRYHLLPMRHDLQLRYEQRRLSGSVAIQEEGQAASLKATAEVPLPLARAPLRADLSLSTPLQRLRPWLQGELAELSGALTLHASASGTLQQPQLEVQAQLPQVEVAQVRGRDITLNLRAGAQGLSADLKARAEAQSDGAALGAVQLQLETPLRVALDRPLAALQRAQDAALSGILQVRGVNLPRLAALYQPANPPFLAGTVEATLDLKGTLAAPRLQVQVRGDQLKTPQIDAARLLLALTYQGDQAALQLNADVNGAPLLQAQASTRLATRALLQGAAANALRAAPLTAQVTIPPYELRRLNAAARGTLRGQVSASGTMGEPSLQAQLQGSQLGYEQWPAGDLRVSGRFDRARGLRAEVQGDQPKGGKLRVEAALPPQPKQPLRLDLVANGYTLDLATSGQPKGPLRVLKGVLDADLHVAGPVAEPRPHGRLHLHDGSLGLSADPRLYRGVELDLSLTEKGAITLRRLRVGAETGEIRASGSAQVDGLKPERVDLMLYARRFPIAAGPVSLWLDSDVAVQGKGQGDLFSGEVVVNNGAVQLPRIGGGQKLQKLGPLEDVVYIDAAARRAAAQEAKRQEQKDKPPPPLDDLPTAARVRIDIPGPFYLRGQEINATAEGRLLLELRGGVPLISGSVRTLSGGWIEILGQRYQIDRAAVSLDGSAIPNPTLDVRISRTLKNASIYVEVHGTAERPRLVLRSDPPIYSESQLIAIIVSGDPGEQRATQNMEQRAVSAISALIVGQIKDRLMAHLPFDVLKVDVGGEGWNLFGQTRVEVGKFLTESLYLGYRHRFGRLSGTRPSNMYEVQLEYRFLRDYLLEAVFGDAAVGSLDLYWTKRF